MMNFVELLKGCPEDIAPIFRFIKFGLFPIIQIGIPIILIVMGSIDLGKAVLSSDDKEIKGATGRLIKRAVAAVAVFFVTTIVSLLLGMFAGTGAQETDAGSWKDCWNDLSRIQNSTNNDD